MFHQVVPVWNVWESKLNSNHIEVNQSDEGADILHVMMDFTPGELPS